MGNYFTTPNSTKHSENSEAGRFQYGVCSMQGWRTTMEDVHLTHSFEPEELKKYATAFKGQSGASVSFPTAPRRSVPKRNAHHKCPSDSPPVIFGVFDGHGGAQVAKFTANHMVDELLKSPAFHEGRYEAAFRNAYVAIDKLLLTDACQEELLRYVRQSSLASGSSNAEMSKEQGSSDSLSSEGSESNELYGVADVNSKSLAPCPSALKASTKTAVRPPIDSSKGVDSPTCAGKPGRRFWEVVIGGVKGAGSAVFSVGRMVGTLGRPTPGLPGLAMLTGCTAITVLLTDTEIIVANAGDSRCVLCRGDTAIELSHDHKPQLPEERTRIISAGGWLEMGRVNGNLNLSRAVGDLAYKLDASLPVDRQIVTVMPDITVTNLTEHDEFLLIGCDGIWESFTSQEIVDFARDRLQAVDKLSDVLESLFEELLSPNPTLFELGCDNMTAIIVNLKHNPKFSAPKLREYQATVEEEKPGELHQFGEKASFSSAS